MDEFGRDLPDETEARFREIHGITWDTRKLHWAVWSVICTWMVHDPDDVKYLDTHHPDAEPQDDGRAKVTLVNGDGHRILCGYFPLSVLFA